MGRGINRDSALSHLPDLPGIYVMMNIITRRMYVGQAKRLRRRCAGHLASFLSGYLANQLLKRDLRAHGPGSFVFFAPLVLRSLAEANNCGGLEFLEAQWIHRLGTCDERIGYNSMVGRARTPAARLRDRERKLFNSGKYEWLDRSPSAYDHLYDPIHPDFLRTWQPTPRVCERSPRKRGS